MRDGREADRGAYTVSVAGVTPQEYPVVQGVPIRNALSDRVHGIPYDRLPFDGVGLQDLLGRGLDFGFCSSFSRIPIGIRRRCNLDVQSDHVVFARNDHDGAVFRVDGAFHLGDASAQQEAACTRAANLDIREISLHHAIHDAPYVCDGILVLDANSQLIPDEGFCALAAK